MKLHGNIITGKWNGNKYKVIGLLGKGGTGRVYKVLDMKSDSYYALKVSEDIQSITKESNMLNKFKHIGAIPKYIELDDYKEGGKTYYFIVIEYIKGENLREYIAKNDLSVRELVAVVIIIGEMISKLHEKGFVFSDLKLENVMMDRENGKIRVIDLGGIVPIGASIKEFTPLYDRAKWNMGSRRADTKYDLFAISMMLVNLIFENESTLSNMSIQDIMYELKRKKIDKGLIELLQRGLYQKKLEFHEFIKELKKMYKTLRYTKKIRYNNRVNLIINTFFVGSLISFGIMLIIVIKTIHN